MGREYYIASCVFTSQFPELSSRIRRYVSERYGMEIVRCCIPKYQVREFEEKMPAGALRESWASLPDGRVFESGDTVWSLCHNCSNIIEELRPGVAVPSLYELILSDAEFAYPDYGGTRVIVQDCWRSRERRAEQEAVRALLGKMNIEFSEQEESFEKTDFCGVSLLRPQPARNPKVAPLHYGPEATAGKFAPHTAEEQKRIMEEYCARFGGEKVVCYCHYCLEGLKLGGADAKHIAELLFPEE